MVPGRYELPPVSGEMNASVPQSIIDAAVEEDPARAAAEWSARVAACHTRIGSREAVAASTGRVAKCDVVGTALAIAHRDKDDRCVLDVVREARPPFSPEQTVETFAALLNRLWHLTGRWGQVRRRVAARAIPKAWWHHI